MSNTLTGLIPSLYASLDVVSREMAGFIPAVTRDATLDRAAKGQLVTIHEAPSAAAGDITPAMTVGGAADQVIGSTTVTINKSRAVPFSWSGVEQNGLDNNGAGYAAIRNNQITQAMRTLVNEMEADIGATVAGAGSAVGVAGTTPFGTSLTESAYSLKALKDRGAPGSDLQMVIDTSAGANMRTLSNLTKANEAGDDRMLRQGVLLDVHGFAIRESAGVANHTAGTAASAATDSSGYAVGDTVITLKAAGTGTLLAGDSITFAGDANIYVVEIGAGSVSGATITLASGLLEPISGEVAITVSADAVQNAAFDRSAIVLAARLPELPEEGDLAVDRTVITDPHSGLSFEVSVYMGYKMIRYEIGLSWGTALIKPEHASILLG